MSRYVIQFFKHIKRVRALCATKYPPQYKSLLAAFEVLTFKSRPICGKR